MKSILFTALVFLPYLNQQVPINSTKNNQPIICPVEKHTDKIIPIVYGKPGQELVAKAKKGELKLGGCLVSPDSPRQHCTKHNKDF